MIAKYTFLQKRYQAMANDFLGQLGKHTIFFFVYECARCRTVERSRYDHWEKKSNKAVHIRDRYEDQERKGRQGGGPERAAKKPREGGASV